MDQRIHKICNWLSNLVKGVSLLTLTCILAIIILVCLAVSKCADKDGTDDEVTLQNTPAEIMKVMPKGEMYVATAIIEDYTTMQRTEYHLSLFPEKHSCVQILRQKVSFIVDLDKVEYTPLDNRTVQVRIPRLEYTASTQESPFISDDEAYWKETLVSNYSLKQKVELQIRSKFDTTENRKKATRYAQEAITHILNQLGLEPVFVGWDEKPRD